MTRSGRQTAPEDLQRNVTLALLHDPFVEGVVAKCSEMHEGVPPEEIRLIAEQVLSNPLFKFARTAYVRLCARDWVMNTHRRLATDDLVIDTALTPPDREDFLKYYYAMNRPLLLPGLAKHWPAVRSWTPDYLKARLADVTVEVMMDRNKLLPRFQSVSPPLRRYVPFPNFVDMCFQTERSNDFYLVAENDFFAIDRTSRLLDDFGQQPLVDMTSPAEDILFWLGPAGTVTPWHFDSCNNLIVLLVGTKRLRICPPYLAEDMKQSTHWYAGCDPFAEGQTDSRHVATFDLEPGDAFFLPVGWWHHVESRLPSVSLSCLNFGVPNSYDKAPTSLE